MLLPVYIICVSISLDIVFNVRSVSPTFVPNRSIIILTVYHHARLYINPPMPIPLPKYRYDIIPATVYPHSVQTIIGYVTRFILYSLACYAFAHYCHYWELYSVIINAWLYIYVLVATAIIQGILVHENIATVALGDSTCIWCRQQVQQRSSSTQATLLYIDGKTTGATFWLDHKHCFHNGHKAVW